MMSLLLPSTSEHSQALLQELVRAAKRMQESSRGQWAAYLSFIKGDLSGQRGTSRESLADDLGIACECATLADLVTATNAYVVFVSNLVAVCGLEASHEHLVEQLIALPDQELAAHLSAIASGAAFEEKGVLYPPHPLTLDWWPGCLDEAGLEIVRTFLQNLDDRHSDLCAIHKLKDPFGRLYLKLAPKALLHPTGEHYTPYWLAEELVRETEWTPGERLLDPFGGSGVAVIAAIDRARGMGVAGLDALEDVCLIELNPVTAALAKANLINLLRDEIRQSDAIVRLPVLCADTLVCALVDCGGFQEDLWCDVQPEVMTQGRIHQQGLHGLSQATLEELGPRQIPLSPSRWLRDAGEPGADEPALGGGEQLEPSAVQQTVSWQLRAADVIVTNPPWVGWEYISQPYRDYLEPLWVHYSLFESTGRDAAFLKEDLSTLALTVAFDRFLAEGGRAALVLRYATMTSNTAAGGLRRLNIVPSNTPLDLRSVRIFRDFRVFDRAVTNAATWLLTKGRPTSFPVQVEEWHLGSGRRAIPADASLEEIADMVERHELSISREEPNEPKSRWTIGDAECLEASKSLMGANPYRARTGVFTGGANAVYYLEPVNAHTGAAGVSWYRNRTERARRKAPKMCSKLEDDLVYEVIRGRDMAQWKVLGNSHLLCPHNRATKMHAIPPAELSANCPHAEHYLEEMRPILDRRKGFSGWEHELREEAFYTILRIGEYTFEPFKVAWKYMASDFVVSVIGPTDCGRPRLPNDKIMYIGIGSEAEAYYLCGVLSSDPIRWKVISSSTSTQISASIIEPIGIPRYDCDDPAHGEISDACHKGHLAMTENAREEARSCLERINAHVAQLFELDGESMGAFAAALSSKFGDRFES